MQKWEYLFMCQSSTHLMINGKATNHDRSNVWGAANELGSEGWELISGTQDDVGRWILCFKRRVD